MRYENLYTQGRGSSSLPPDCQRAVRAIPDVLSKRYFFRLNNPKVQTALDSYLTQISCLPPETIVSASAHIRVIAAMYSYSRYQPQPQLSTYNKINKQINLLQKYPDLATLYIFHGDGFVREEALKRIDPRHMSPFLFSAIVFRLNDWVGPVRAAAADLLRRIHQENQPDQYISALPFLSVQTQKWRRWKDSKEAFNSILNSAEIVDRLVLGLVAARTGPLLRQLRVLLTNPMIDRHLPLLAQASHSPQIRATAMDALLNQEVRWRVKTSAQWIDKRYNIKRKVPVWETRTLSRLIDITEFIETAVSDKSVIVRRVAASRIYKFGAELKGVEHLVSKLTTDKSPAIRRQIAYFLDKA